VVFPHGWEVRSADRRERSVAVIADGDHACAADQYVAVERSIGANTISIAAKRNGPSVAIIVCIGRRVGLIDDDLSADGDPLVTPAAASARRRRKRCRSRIVPWLLSLVVVDDDPPAAVR
jgi:hypothetical protein